MKETEETGKVGGVNGPSQDNHRFRGNPPNHPARQSGHREKDGNENDSAVFSETFFPEQR